MVYIAFFTLKPRLLCSIWNESSLKTLDMKKKTSLRRGENIPFLEHFAKGLVTRKNG